MKARIISTPILVTLAIVGWVCLTPTVHADINDGVIAAWTFDDGKVSDSIGSTHGELIDGAKIVKDGKFGSALDVDGVKAYAAIDIPDKIESVLEEAFSVSYWLFVRNGVDHAGVWKGEMIGWGANFTFRMVTTSSANFTWGVTQAAEECWFATDGVLETEKWIHVCQTVDGKQVIGYVTKEGDKRPEIPVSAQNNPRPCPAPYNLFPDKPLEMGRGVGIGGVAGDIRYLDGIIDDVIIWDRALSEDEVAELGQGKRPDSALSVKSEGKLATTWGKVKTFHANR